MSNGVNSGAASTRAGKPRCCCWRRLSPESARDGSGRTPFSRIAWRRSKGWFQKQDIAAAKADWEAVCEVGHRHTLARAREVQRVARVHRDPFEPILPILEAASPVGEYRKIADEVLRQMPNDRRYPRAAAEAVRSFLLIRLGLHLGLRQKNLRQLLVTPRGEMVRTERELEAAKRGELRWSARDAGWEVFIPCAAFKNAGSAYFSKRPYRMLLPDLGGLYRYIDRYLKTDRPALLAGASDPRNLLREDRQTNQQGRRFHTVWIL